MNKQRLLGVVAVSALLILLLILAVRCGGAEEPAPKTAEKPAETARKTEEKTEPAPVTEEKTAEAPVTEPATEPAKGPVVPRLFFFIDSDKAYTPYEEVTSYTHEWKKDEDIGSFGVIPDVTVEGKRSYASLWRAAKEAYPDLALAKLGYILTFETSTGLSFVVDLLSPENTVGDFNPFLDVYLYDDVINEGHWYSHLTEADFNSSTLVTSVKITGRERVDEISSISLSVYLYFPNGVRTEALTLPLTEK